MLERGFIKQITAVVLASGFSKRMGCNKLLMPYKGRTIIGHVFELLGQLGFGRVVVVTAYEAIREMAKDCGFETVMNDGPQLGQSRSVVLGTAASPASEGWLFFNGDMPFIQPDTVWAIMDRAQKCKNKIIVPRYGGHPGQPVYFPSECYGELTTLTGDGGGRQIIRRYPEWVVYVDIADEGQGTDIDTPEAYAQYIGGNL